MKQKLTNKSSLELPPKQLTSNHNSPFLLGLKHKLEKGYSFKEMQVKNNKAFQKFLDAISTLTVFQVDKSYGREPDKKDFYGKKTVRHYEVTKKFRLHVILEDGVYFIVKLDPNHSVHQ